MKLAQQLKLAAALCCSALAWPAFAGGDAALMVVAHGAIGGDWNKRVISMVDKIDWPGPRGVAFLTSVTAENELTNVAARLDQPGVKKIYVVPLLVSSFSSHYEEIRYDVGLRKDLPKEAAAEHGSSEAEPQLKTRAALILTPAMDGHPLVSQILADEVKPFATNAANQSVVLVAHGPNEDAENERWLAHLGAHARKLQQQFGFKRIDVVTLRDDAPKEIRNAATEQLRQTVGKGAADSKVLVLPVLISVGHVQKEIRKRLDGLTFTMVESGLADSPLAAEWVRKQASDASQAKAGQ